MANSKTTKRALLTSALAILACVAMLMGATFAWFTDAASTGVNRIVSGNLDIEVSYAKEEMDENGQLTGRLTEYQTIEESTEVFDPNALWEPGRVEYIAFLVENKGSLALKYRLSLNILAQKAGINKAGNEFWLADHLCASVKAADEKNFAFGSGYGSTGIPSNDAFMAKANDLSKAGTSLALAKKPLSDAFVEGTLEAGEKQAVAMAVWMPESVGNEANAIDTEHTATIDFGINVVATQDTVEHDSFGNDYDQDAEYPVIDLAELTDALKNGGIVNVPEDLPYGEVGDTLEDRVVIDQPTTLNLDGKLISPDNMGNNNNNFVALMVRADTTINATANGGIDTGVNGGYGINVLGGATLVINGGEYYGGGTAVQVQKGTLIINGGHFAVEPFGEPWGYNFVLNCVDSAYKDGTAKIIIKGGTFVNFDPSNNPAEGAGTNFVADGYHVESETHGSDIWYTVVAD